MAGTLTLCQSMQVNNLAFVTPKIGVNNSQEVLTAAGNGLGCAGTTLPVTAAGIALDLVATYGFALGGWIMFHNLDQSLNIKWGRDNAGALGEVGEMQPGEWAGPFRVPTTAGHKFRFTVPSGTASFEFVYASP